MVKDKVHGAYMANLMKEHGAKRHPGASDTFMALTGSAKEDSIGEAIKNKFGHRVNELIEDVIESHFNFEDYTGLIMCHGYTYMDWLENVDDEQTKHIIDVNLYGSIRLIKQFVNDTIKTPYRKKIIAIGSMAYNKVLNGSAAYCASKAGLNMFIRCAAWELAPKGYDVFIIHPSNVESTPMTHDTLKHLMRYRNLDINDAIEYWEAGALRENLLTKDEIVELVEFIVYSESNYLAGGPIELGGGNR
jgi:NAD(P)-dependent dehydrogenase (short-subunit alcohol dehydrogenase family)